LLGNLYNPTVKLNINGNSLGNAGCYGFRSLLDFR
jgi:hypothetical protein